MNDNKSAYNSHEYDNRISQTLPHYEDLHSQVIDLIRVMDFHKINWLDTGCGTGKTASKALAELSGIDIDFTLCDISSSMLEVAQSRLADTNITYRNISSQELDYKDEFDVVTAIQCHHYLSPEERKKAVKNCYHALKENGIFITFENIRLENNTADLLAVKRWKNYMLSKGKTLDEIEKHAARRETEVHPITITEHLDILKECDFKHVELLWFSYLQAGFWAIK